jgi:hypothetical protein
MKNTIVNEHSEEPTIFASQTFVNKKYGASPINE